MKPTKIVCVGRNYAAHARELGNEVPDEPLLFFKPPSTLVEPGESIVLPTGLGRVDFEGEIGVWIGRRARRVGVDQAWACTAGVAPLNDVTARELQRREKQWARAKGCDTFCPVGAPVPVAERDLPGLEVITRVNGVVRQHGRAADMVFSIPFLIAHISAYMTLEPGDLIATGTPDGVGPLAPGDEVEVEIPGVGRLLNPVVVDEP